MQADERWISFKEAVELVRQRFGWSIGRCEALVRTARTSGEVRHWRFNDDGIVDGEPSGPIFYSADDLEDWLGRQQAPQVAPSVPAKRALKRRHSPKREAAEQACRALWPPRGRPPETLVNDVVYTQVFCWLKENRNLTGPATPSTDTIKRAAGRK